MIPKTNPLLTFAIGMLNHINANHCDVLSLNTLTQSTFYTSKQHPKLLPWVLGVTSNTYPTVFATLPWYLAFRASTYSTERQQNSFQILQCPTTTKLGANLVVIWQMHWQHRNRNACQIQSEKNSAHIWCLRDFVAVGRNTSNGLKK